MSEATEQLAWIKNPCHCTKEEESPCLTSVTFNSFHISFTQIGILNSLKKGYNQAIWIMSLISGNKSNNIGKKFGKKLKFLSNGLQFWVYKLHFPIFWRKTLRLTFGLHWWRLQDTRNVHICSKKTLETHVIIYKVHREKGKKMCA